MTGAWSPSNTAAVSELFFGTGDADAELARRSHSAISGFLTPRMGLQNPNLVDLLIWLVTGVCAVLEILSAELGSMPSGEATAALELVNSLYPSLDNIGASECLMQPP